MVSFNPPFLARVNGVSAQTMTTSSGCFDACLSKDIGSVLFCVSDCVCSTEEEMEEGWTTTTTTTTRTTPFRLSAADRFSPIKNDHAPTRKRKTPTSPVSDTPRVVVVVVPRGSSTVRRALTLSLPTRS